MNDQEMSKATDVVGRRLGAAVIDHLMIWIINFIVFIIMASHIAANDNRIPARITTKIYNGQELSQKDVEKIMDVVRDWLSLSGQFFTYLLIVALLSFVYFAVLQGLTGWTLGKLACGVRLIGEDGKAPGVLRGTLRQLLLFIDYIPGPPVVGIVAMIFTGKHQRVGDLAAKTYVIRKPESPQA